jgi:glycosyltransferase involved in cell wall biosynthesis
MPQKTLPTVSIGIPTYNRADGYLQECLNSALNQSYSDIEIIVADNCSADNTEEIVKSFATARIRYYKHKNNIGPENNFNFCLDQANGTYFLLLHDDDLVDPDFVEVCMEAADYRTDIGIIRSGIRIIDSVGEIIRECPNSVSGLAFEQFILGWYTNKTAWYLTNTLYNTAKLKEMGGFHSRHQLFQDCVATATLASKYDRVDVEDIKASFRKHKGEITFSVKVKDWCEDFIDFIDLVDDLATSDKRVLRSEGEKFFASLSYNRTANIASFTQRFLTYWMVYRKFHFNFPPPPVLRLKRKVLRFLSIKSK